MFGKWKKLGGTHMGVERTYETNSFLRVYKLKDHFVCMHRYSRSLLFEQFSLTSKDL